GGMELQQRLEGRAVLRESGEVRRRIGGFALGLRQAVFPVDELDGSLGVGRVEVAKIGLDLPGPPLLPGLGAFIEHPRPSPPPAPRPPPRAPPPGSARWSRAPIDRPAPARPARTAPGFRSRLPRRPGSRPRDPGRSAAGPDRPAWPRTSRLPRDWLPPGWPRA